MSFIALTMFVISVGSWRYQGDTHHMQTKIFKSENDYSEEVYLAFWKQHITHSSFNNVEMKMEVIHIYEMFRQVSIEHPSEVIMNKIIESDEWRRFVPNSNSSTYKMSQKVWMSQNLTARELMNYALRVN